MMKYIKLYDNLNSSDAIDFVLWLIKNFPDTLYKYSEDDDGGLGAITDMYNLFKS